MIRRVKKHFSRNFLAWWVVFMSFVTLTAGIFFGIRLVKGDITTYFQQVDEKKSLQGLEVFHQGMDSLYKSFFYHRRDMLKGLSLNQSLRDAIANNNSGQIQAKLDEERKTEPVFESNMVIDGNGKVLNISSDDPELAQFVGQDFSQRGYVAETMATKAPQVVHVPMTTTGKNKVFFTAPSINAAGDVAYIVTGSLSLGGLSNSMYIKPDFNKYETLLLDQSGEILLRNGEEPSLRNSIKDSDTAVAQLILENKPIEDEEVNYEGKNVFVVGTNMDMGQQDKMYLVTYYPMDEFKAEADQISAHIDRAYTSLAFWSAFAFVISIGIFLWLFNIHVKKVRNWD